MWPMLIGLGVSALANYLGSKTAANASKEAAQTQSDYGQKALELFGQIYQQQRADQEPFRQGGMQALNAVLAGGGYAPVSTGTAAGAPDRVSSWMDSQHTYDPNTGQGLLDGYIYQDPATGYLQPTDYAKEKGMDFTASQYQPEALAQGPVAQGMTRMRAPDGTIKDVFNNQVAHYQSLGATVIKG